jgi:pyruvate formate lyase activating enzyme
MKSTKKTHESLVPPDTKGIRCDYCSFQCMIPQGKTGTCGIRLNDQGTLRTLGHLELIGPQIDPIEKKPLYHFMPGCQTFSIAQKGCNFRCGFCQNYPLADPEYFHLANTRTFTIQKLVETWQSMGRLPVAFTYAEPAVWQDLVIEFGTMVHAAGGTNILVSNGCYSTTGRARLMEVAQAFNIDLKGTKEFYHTYARAPRQPVLDTLEVLAKSPNHHLEVTTLYIPGIHDKSTMEQLYQELAELGVETWHISAFHPAFKMQRGYRRATRAELEPIAEWAKKQEKIRWIHLGNV